MESGDGRLPPRPDGGIEMFVGECCLKVIIPAAKQGFVGGRQAEQVEHDEDGQARGECGADVHFAVMPEGVDELGGCVANVRFERLADGGR
jgi:hypothetical protein